MARGKHAKPAALPKVTPVAAAAVALSAGGALLAAPAEAAALPAGHPVLPAQAGVPEDYPQAIRHEELPVRYTVQPGDTLSGIASRLCSQAADWPALWEANRAVAPDPNLIYPGDALTVACQMLPGAAVAAAQWEQAHQPPVQQAVPQQAPQPAGPASVPVTASYGGSYGDINPADYSGMLGCILTRESGGQSQVMNSSGHYGLFQFSYSTWVGHGGDPATFGHASIQEQFQVFYATSAADPGYSDWAPYDGC